MLFFVDAAFSYCLVRVCYNCTFVLLLRPLRSASGLLGALRTSTLKTETLWVTYGVMIERPQLPSLRLLCLATHFSVSQVWPFPWHLHFLCASVSFLFTG